jgi:cysteine-rich repeat protein
MSRKILRIALLALPCASLACGSRRIAGYLEEDCATTTSAAESTTPSSDVSGETTTAEASTTTTEASTTTTSDDLPGATTTATTLSSSTGEPDPVCGNGVVEAFGAVPEECDDGNLVPDDGCDDTCAADIRVFVTSTTFKAGELMSLYLADAQCLQLAFDALEFDGRFRAWLSDSATDIRDVVSGRGRLVMVDGRAFSSGWDALLAGEVLTPLEVTEQGEIYHGGVWTGTRPDGTAAPDSDHCADWSSNDGEGGYYGYSDEVSSDWTLAEVFDNPTVCISPFALYCWEEH